MTYHVLMRTLNLTHSLARFGNKIKMISVVRKRLAINQSVIILCVCQFLQCVALVLVLLAQLISSCCICGVCCD